MTESIQANLEHFGLSEKEKENFPQLASTIHRLLRPLPPSIHFRRHASSPLNADFVIIDEASMVDLPLMSKLIDAIKPTSRLLLIGDVDQLAPVEAGAPLASIRISNTDTDYGFWYRNGSPQSQGYEEIDTGLDFVQGELQELTGVIDFESNRWSAEIDGLPLFTEAVFNGTNRPLYFGFIAIEWQIAQGSTRDFGDNFLLLSDLRLETVEDPPPPVRISSIRQSADGNIQIAWQAAPGYNYAVEYSDNLLSWQGDLSGSSFSAPQQSQTFLFTDATSQRERRFYRIIQTSAE